jgi:hypothetical protein
MSFLDSNTPPINGQKVPSPVGQSVTYSPEAIQAEHRAKWLAAQEKVTAIKSKLAEVNQQFDEANALIEANGVRLTNTLEKFKGEPIYQLNALDSGNDLGIIRRISAKEARRYNSNAKYDSDANYIYFLGASHIVTFVTELEARQYFGRMPHPGRRPQAVQQQQAADMRGQKVPSPVGQSVSSAPEVRFDCINEKVKHNNVYRILRNGVFVGTLRRSYVSETRKPWVFIGTDESPYFSEKTPFDDFEQAYKGMAEVIAGYDAIMPATPQAVQQQQAADMRGQTVPSPVGQSVILPESPIDAKIRQFEQQKAELIARLRANGVKLKDSFRKFKREPIFEVWVNIDDPIGKFNGENWQILGVLSRISASELRDSEQPKTVRYIYINNNTGYRLFFNRLTDAYDHFASAQLTTHQVRAATPQPVQQQQAADMRGQTASPLVTIEKSQNFANLWLVRVSREGQSFAFGHVAVSPRQKIWKFQYQNNNIATGSLDLDWQTAAKAAILVYLSPKQSFIMDALDAMEQTLLTQVYSCGNNGHITGSVLGGKGR